MRTALITGANKSIGYETARILASKGIFVYIGSRNIIKGETAVKALNNEGLSNVKAVAIDITQPETIKNAATQIQSEQGHLDILINNAGINGGMPQAASNTNIETIKKTFETNFYGTISATQAFISQLKDSDNPVIVNVTSGLGSLTLQTDPNWQFYNYKSAAYGPSKTALNAYTIALAFELKDFRINAVDPGFTATDFNNHGGHFSVEASAKFVSQYALIDKDGPTGKYFSHDYDKNNHESPW